MKINIKGTHLELTPAITAYIEKRMNGLDKFVNPEDTSVSVDFEVSKTTQHHQSGDIFCAEATMHAGTDNFRAESSQADLYAAIDIVKDGIARAITDNKKKKRTLVKRGGAILKSIMKGFRRK